MTLENCKKWLAHYEKTGNEEAASDMRAKLVERGETITEPKRKK